MTLSSSNRILKNFIAPEVRVSKSIPAETISEKQILQAAEACGLQLISRPGQYWKFQFTGYAATELSQMKVVLGFSPDEAAFEKLQSYFTVQADTDAIQLHAFERILLGSAKEQAVYRKILARRLEKFERCLQEIHA